MISDEALAEGFCRELEQTQQVVPAVRAVRLALEAYREERRHQRQRLDEGGRAGPTARAALDVDQVDFIVALTADELGMSVDALRTGAARSSLHARWVVAGVLRQWGMSLWVIARALGMTDHTRVLDGLRRLAGFPGLLACRDRVIDRLHERGWKGPPAPATGAHNGCEARQ